MVPVGGMAEEVVYLEAKRIRKSYLKLTAIVCKGSFAAPLSGSIKRTS